MVSSIYLVLLFQLCFFSFNQISGIASETTINDLRSAKIHKIDELNEDAIVDYNDEDEAEVRRIYNLLRLLSSATANNDDDEWSSNGPVAKRAFKMLRVGRSIGSMAHRLPRMG